MSNNQSTPRNLTPAQLQIFVKNTLQLSEMRSDFHRQETARALGIAPEAVTELQLHDHYEKCGRALAMREVNGDDNYWLTGLRLQHNPRDLPPGERENELWNTFLEGHPGQIPTFVPYCLRQELRIPPCYEANQVPICMRDGHPECEFAKTASTM